MGDQPFHCSPTLHSRKDSSGETFEKHVLDSENPSNCLFMYSISSPEERGEGKAFAITPFCCWHLLDSGELELLFLFCLHGEGEDDE